MTREENTNSIIAGLKDILDIQDLRPSQIDVLNQYMTNPQEHQTGVFDLATGFGKTRVMTVLSLAYLEKIQKGG